MNGYIVSRSVVGLQEAIKKAMETTQSAAVKAYFQEILKLPQEDQEKWFFSSGEVGRIGREEYLAKKGDRGCLQEFFGFCVQVKFILNLFDEVSNLWKKKQVESIQCQEIHVSGPSALPVDLDTYPR